MPQFPAVSSIGGIPLIDKHHLWMDRVHQWNTTYKSHRMIKTYINNSDSLDFRVYVWWYMAIVLGGMPLQRIGGAIVLNGVVDSVLIRLDKFGLSCLHWTPPFTSYGFRDGGHPLRVSWAYYVITPLPQLVLSKLYH